MEPLKGMKCHRCDGAMVYEKFYSEDDRFWGMEVYYLWRNS